MILRRVYGDGATRSNFVLTATLTEADGNIQNSTASYSGSGKYVINFNATKSGTATVRVYLNSTLVGNGNYFIEVLPAAPFAPLSYPFGFADGVNAVAGVTGSFFVQLRDGFGNNITTDVGNVVATSITPQFNSNYSLQLTGTYASDVKCYIVNYNVTLSGNFTLTVTVNAAGTNDSVHSLQVFPAAVYPETSVLYGVSSTATAGVMQLAYLQLKDVFGNNASNSSVDIYFDANQINTIVNGTVVGCTEGLCQISYPSVTTLLPYYFLIKHRYNLTIASYGSHYVITALVNGRSVVGSVVTYVTVSPAALSPSVSYAYPVGDKSYSMSTRDFTKIWTGPYIRSSWRICLFLRTTY
jgi:hypothetical protein